MKDASSSPRSERSPSNRSPSNRPPSNRPPSDSAPPAPTTTALLRQARSGDAAAADALYSRVYDQLRRLAHVVRGPGAPATVNTTALVHEAYEHLRPDEGLDVESKQHFFRLAARAMRQVLMREARHRNAQKRGGHAVTVPFYDRMIGAELPLADLLSIEGALQSLDAMQPRQVRVVECRFFAGLTVEETARALGVSTSTVKRDWRAARAWLIRYLRPENGSALASEPSE